MTTLKKEGRSKENFVSQIEKAISKRLQMCTKISFITHDKSTIAYNSPNCIASKKNGSLLLSLLVECKQNRLSASIAEHITNTT